MDNQKLQIDAMAKQANVELQAQRIASENQREGARIGARLAADLDNAQRDDRREGAKLGIEIAKELARGEGVAGSGSSQAQNRGVQGKR